MPVILFLTFLVGVAACRSQKPAYTDLANDIPENANRIILEQEGVPAVDVYIDVLNYMQRHGFNILGSENSIDKPKLEVLLNDRPLNLYGSKQIRPDLALKIYVNVNKLPSGGQLIASVKYADVVHTDVPNWKQARWTDGKSKRAFYQALEILRGTAYDYVDFEIGAAVFDQRGNP